MYMLKNVTITPKIPPYDQSQKKKTRKNKENNRNVGP